MDPTPGFSSLSNRASVQRLYVPVEVGRVKNVNKNPVAEKAIHELEEELLRQEPRGPPLRVSGLALATARLNSRIRHLGLSSICDYKVIAEKHQQRTSNHTYSEKSKNHSGLLPQTPELQVGDLVYLLFISFLILCRAKIHKTKGHKSPTRF